MIHLPSVVVDRCAKRLNNEYPGIVREAHEILGASGSTIAPQNGSVATKVRRRVFAGGRVIGSSLNVVVR
jgi:hypothetical protein